ncbi:MAG: hypothetical protein ACI4A8_08930 [Muribaculaceae bacterium]
MRKLLWFLLGTFCAPALLAMAQVIDFDPIAGNPADNPDTATVVNRDNYLKRLPGTFPISEEKEQKKPDKNDMIVEIKAMARTYGDSIVLRWGVNSFPEWLYLSTRGYRIMRYDSKKAPFDFDTIADCIKPLSLEQFKLRYPDTNDSLAYIAMGSLYGTGDLDPENIGYEPGSIGSFAEIEQDQKNRLIGAYMASEWRPDLAEALGLRFVDRNVKKDEVYSYFIFPRVPDTTGRLFIAPAALEYVKNTRRKGKPYNVSLTAEINEHCKVTLAWNDTTNGTFEVYRRPYGSKEWTKLTDRPYAPPLNMEFEKQGIIYSHESDRLGTFEYAVQAHDAFGELTEMSEPVKVVFRDLMPPSAPEITLIEIDRPGKQLWDSIYATIHFHKDSMEADFVRLVPLYHSNRDSLKQWRLLSNEYIAPTDTTVRVDVTHLSTGWITIAAVDTAENMGYGIPRYLRIAQTKPPVAPTHIRAIPSLNGSIAILWDMPDSANIKHYDVFFANSLEHSFARANNRHLHTRSFTDTVATDLNERYIYYTVQAFDWDDNPGEYSDTIAVLRPNPSIPSKAHLDSAWVDNRMIHTRWVGAGDAVISHYNVYRRSEGAERWGLLCSFNADSVAANNHMMTIHDTPGGRRGDRFEYAVETVSFWGATSGLTPIYSAKLNIGVAVEMPIKLFGAYNEADRQTRLAWEITNVPIDVPYYICLYRKSHGSQRFKYITNIPSDKKFYIDHSVQPGETAEYYIMLRFDDGRESPRSETVTVTAPAKTISDNK